MSDKPKKPYPVPKNPIIAFIRSAKKARQLVDSYMAQSQPKTISGLMLHLGFCSRQSYYQYVARGGQIAEEFRRAHLLIEQHYEELLQRGGNAGGPIFALKNLDWADSRQVDVTSQGQPINQAEPVSIIFEEIARSEESK